MKTRRQGDLYPLDFNQLAWDANDPAGVIEQLAAGVSGQAESSIAWYLTKKSGQRRGAQCLRVVAILLTTAAALIPILAEIYAIDGKPAVSSAWSTVALVLALSMVMLDHFFGFSSAWMRFIATELQIREALHAFQMDWQILRAGFQGGQPDARQVQQALERCRSFLAQIDSLLRTEAESWITEFRAALREIDEAAKARAELVKTGAANVVVDNGEQCQDGWRLSVDGGPSSPQHGKTTALANLLPGTHVLSVNCTIGGRDVSATKAFAVAAGSIAEVESKLV